MLTEVPAGPEDGDMLVTAGAGTVKATPLLAIPLLPVTTTLPVLASVGTDVLMLPSLQLETVAVTPLKVTVPAVDPKLDPEIVTAAPALPDVGDKLLMFGVWATLMEENNRNADVRLKAFPVSRIERTSECFCLDSAPKRNLASKTSVSVFGLETNSGGAPILWIAATPKYWRTTSKSRPPDYFF